MRAVLAIKYAFVSLQHFTSTKLDERPTRKTKNEREKTHTHTHNKFVTIGYLPLAYALCKKRSRPSVRPKRPEGRSEPEMKELKIGLPISAYRQTIVIIWISWYLFLSRTATAASFLPYGLWPQHSKCVLELDGTTTKMPMYFLCVSLRVWWMSVCVRRNVYLYFAFFSFEYIFCFSSVDSSTVLHTYIPYISALLAFHSKLCVALEMSKTKRKTWRKTQTNKNGTKKIYVK